MDPVTHGLIGASAALSFADNEKMNYAAVIGAASAMMPDLDILINSSSDPLLQLEFHRQFTHSLLFIPVGALIVSGLLWWFVKKKLSFKETYFWGLIGIATAGLADTITSYGVHLLWPLTDVRIAWNLISVFDPLFTLGIITLVAFALLKKKRFAAQAAFIWIALYLLLGLSQQQKAKSVAKKIADQRNHEIEQLIVKPTIANELLWSIRYVSNDTLYADGVRLLPFSDPDIFRGNSIPLLNWEQKYGTLQGTVLYKDISRFAKLSNGFLITYPDSNQVIADGRYAMLPTSVKPLWGIKIDTTKPGKHVAFNTYRDASPRVREDFTNMLFGNNKNDPSPPL